MRSWIRVISENRDKPLIYVPSVPEMLYIPPDEPEDDDQVTYDSNGGTGIEAVICYPSDELCLISLTSLPDTVEEFGTITSEFYYRTGITNQYTIGVIYYKSEPNIPDHPKTIDDLYDGNELSENPPVTKITPRSPINDRKWHKGSVAITIDESLRYSEIHGLMYMA